MKSVYIAGPFRGVDHWAMAQNVHRAREYGMDIAHLGALPIIPHSMFSEFHGTLTDEFWIEATKELLYVCHAAFFMPGWQSSVGSQGEYKAAGDRGQPRFDRIADVQTRLETGELVRSDL